MITNIVSLCVDHSILEWLIFQSSYNLLLFRICTNSASTKLTIFVRLSFLSKSLLFVKSENLKVFKDSTVNKIKVCLMNVDVKKPNKAPPPNRLKTFFKGPVATTTGISKQTLVSIIKGGVDTNTTLQPLGMVSLQSFLYLQIV